MFMLFSSFFGVLSIIGLSYWSDSSIIRGNDEFKWRTTELDKVITNDDLTLGDGIDAAIGKTDWWTQIQWVRDWENQDFEWFVKDLLNYFLGLLFIVTFIYLLYHAFLSLTSPWDEEQMKKSIWAIKIASFVLFGIALSWFIISQIFDVLGV